MKRLLNYLPVHFVIFLILGICIQFYYKIWCFGFLHFLSVFGIILLTLFLVKSKIIKTFLSCLLFFFIGISTVYFQNKQNYTNYYQNFIDNNSTKILKINKVLKPGFYHFKFEAKVIQIDDYKTCGSVLLNLKKDTLHSGINVDDILLVKTDFLDVMPPLNPHQFDYKSYLAKKGITQQIFIDKNHFKKLVNNDISLFGLSASFRNKVQNSLKIYHFKDDELGVISALLLGQRQGVSKDLIDDYSKAGAIHILAVSGLHVGVILLILNWLFKPLEVFKNGKILKTIVVIIFLWSFAFVAGLSASVIRAVTMFTFVAFGLFFRKRNFVEFSLISSMFFLLLFKPMFLFDVGFQLSYLAVFGIVWVQPKLVQIWHPKLKIINFFWRLFTVSIAAQIGILPLSIYYFHQIPGLFLLSNLIIIPFLGAILLGGIIIILLSVLDILPQFFADFYGKIISIINSFVQWISNQEAFLFEELSLSFWMMISMYLIVFSFVLLVFKYSPKKLLFFLGSIIVVQSVLLIESKQRVSKEEFIVFHKSRYSILGERLGNQLTIYHTTNSNNHKFLNSYKVGEKVSLNYTNQLKNIYSIKNKNILIVDSLGVYNIKQLKNPIVILQQSPKINLERLIKVIKPMQIIADGSNYKSYMNLWEEVSKKENIPFYNTSKKGAFIIK